MTPGLRSVTPSALGRIPRQSAVHAGDAQSAETSRRKKPDLHPTTTLTRWVQWSILERPLLTRTVMSGDVRYHPVTVLAERLPLLSLTSRNGLPADALGGGSHRQRQLEAVSAANAGRISSCSRMEVERPVLVMGRHSACTPPRREMTYLRLWLFALSEVNVIWITPAAHCGLVCWTIAAQARWDYGPVRLRQRE